MKISAKIVVPFVLSAAVACFPGCIKELKPEQDFGAEVQATSISEALKIAAPQHPADMLVGEFVYSETSAQVEGGSPFVAGQRGITITGREDHSDHVLFSFVEEIGELVDGKIVTSSKEYVGRVDLPQATSQEKIQLREAALPFQVLKLFPQELLRSKEAAIMPSAEADAAMLPQAVTTSTVTTSEVKYTYHNFSKKDIFWPVPDEVRKREKCGGLGLEVCASGIPAIQMVYSRVKWTGSTGDKQDFVVVLSSQTPFLAAQLMTCVEGFVSYQGQRLRLTQCEEVKDFRFGKLPNSDPQPEPEPTPEPEAPPTP